MATLTFYVTPVFLRTGYVVAMDDLALENRVSFNLVKINFDENLS